MSYPVIYSKKEIEENMKSKDKKEEIKDCPNCGRCPVCGRQDIEVQPWYPYPYYPRPYVYPWGDSGTAWTSDDPNVQITVT